MNARLAALLSLLWLTGCPQPNPANDGGTPGTAPVLTSISPTRGPLAGSTTVTLTGTSFVAGATVAFGGNPATVTFENDRRLLAVTPAAATPGAVSVTVTNPGGKTSTLADAFTYESTSNTKTIAEATLQNPADATETAGGATVTVVVVGHVQVPTVTAGSGQGAGVRAQVGFSSTVGATPLGSDFTWSDAQYVGDVDGPTTGDKARDSYSGAVMLPAPTTAQTIYYLAIRFSVDGGTTWTIADRDGSSNGTITTQLSRVTVSRASVEWCKLGGEIVTAPPTVSLRGNAMGPTIYGQVFKAGVTSSMGAGMGIKGQLGYGAPGSDPATWTWTPATFNTDTGGGANDEFQAQLPNPGAGTYKFAFRFNHQDGPWSYCDADGLALNGFTEDQAGSLTVAAEGIDNCVLQHPDALTSYEGRMSANVYGRVYAMGVTDGVGQGAGVEGQLGYGPAGSAPTDATWTWGGAANFNVDDVNGGGDEYLASFAGPAAGNWLYTWRFRLNGGAWVYCDRDGSTNGVQQAQLGVLTAAPFDVATCLLENANSSQTALAGATTQAYSALVNVPTLTDGMGQGTPLVMELGTGPLGTPPTSWTTWNTAMYVDDATTSDRYRATLTAPTTTGAYAVAFRARVGTRPYAYCDLDGSQNGFADAQAGRLNVVSAVLQSCKLETVSSAMLPSGSALTVTARATVPGPNGTGNAGAAPNLRVQIGVGPNLSNASTSNLWGWKEAAYSTEATGADEFALTLFPAYTGGREISARASLDGTTWTYCDLDGSDVGGYTQNMQYYVNVTPHTDTPYCATQPPANAAPGALVYGQVYKPPFTPDASTPFIAQLGIGEESADPGTSWTWAPATFNVTVGNNNEYMRTLPDAGGLRYAFRFSLDGGVWCYGDIDGSGNGFSGGSNIGTITP
ncbi:MAG: IPT/TIG domain-containing protein [Myxococcota bacterium]